MKTKTLFSFVLHFVEMFTFFFIRFHLPSLCSLIVFSLNNVYVWINKKFWKFSFLFLHAFDSLARHPPSPLIRPLPWLALCNFPIFNSSEISFWIIVIWSKLNKNEQKKKCRVEFFHHPSGREREPDRVAAGQDNSTLPRNFLSLPLFSCKSSLYTSFNVHTFLSPTQERCAEHP